MTFGTYVQAVVNAVFPEGAAENLAQRHRNAVNDALVDLQRKVRCLRDAHCSVTPAENSFDNCNASVIPMIVGTLTKVYICKAESACDFFVPAYVKPDAFSILVRDTSACFTEAYTALDEETVPPPEPRAASPCTTEAILRPVLPSSTRCVGYYTFDRDAIRIYPPLVAGEVAVVQWNGIRKDWEDGEDVGVRLGMRDVIKAVELFLESDAQRFENKDGPQASGAYALYNVQVADLIYTCRRNGFPVPALENPYGGGFASVSTPAATRTIYHGKLQSPNASASSIQGLTTKMSTSRFVTVLFDATAQAEFVYISLPIEFGVGVIPTGFVIGEGVGTPVPMATPDDETPYGSQKLYGYWFEEMVIGGSTYRTFRTSLEYFGDIAIEIR